METDGLGKNIDDKSDDDDPTYNVVEEELELSRDDRKNDYIDPISETITMFTLIKDIKFNIGLTFINKVPTIDAIRVYVVTGGYKIRFKKNDRKRARAKCFEGYKWENLISNVGMNI
ncbi:hypothetical protein ACFE04_013865 [Oxalis oulophora]